MKAFLKRALMVLAVFSVGTAVAQTQPQMIRIGNSTANDGMAAVNDKFAELLTKYSDGRFKAAAYQGETLGTIAQMLGALQAGSIHGMIFPAGFVSTIVPSMSLLDLPFLLPGTPAKITAFAAQSHAAVKMKEEAEQKGIHVLGFFGIGAQSFLTTFPVHKLADIQGKKFRVVPSPARVGAYKDWGAVARPMELGEVYTALQQGTLDGMENPPDVIYKMKLYEAAKYYTITEHFAFVGNVIVSKKWFDGLPKDLQEVVNKAGKDSIAFADTTFTKSQADGMAALKKNKNVVVTNMPAAEIQKMKDLVKAGVWVRMANDPQKGPVVKLLEEDVVRFNKH
jgi:tripartite ATP-independent transporter DctP family solute receptor